MLKLRPDFKLIIYNAMANPELIPPKAGLPTKPLRLRPPLVSLWLSAASLVTAVLVLKGFLIVNVSWLLVAAAVVGAIGATFRLIKDLDEWATANHIEKRSGPFAEFIYKLFRGTPLRILTLNKLEQRMNFLRSRDAQLVANAERKQNSRDAKKNGQKPDEAVDKQKLQDERTASFIIRSTDYRKHMGYLVGVVLSVGAGMKIFSQAAQASPLKLITSIFSYTIGVVLSVAHVDAYVKRRAFEPNPRPIFIILNKAMRWLPTRLLANWLIKRDHENVQAVMRGDQTWRWRMFKSLFDKLPEGMIKRWFMRQLDSWKMEVNPRVLEILKERGAEHSIDMLKRTVEEKTVPNTDAKINLAEAYRDLKCGLMSKKLGLGKLMKHINVP
jgi:uncharacterized small protein (DUF1192 family)